MVTIAIGLGKKIKTSELKEIANGKKENVYSVERFDQLQANFKKMIKNICQSPKVKPAAKVTPKPPTPKVTPKPPGKIPYSHVLYLHSIFKYVFNVTNSSSKSDTINNVYENNNKVETLL